jgi:hypothetical protein
LTLFDEDPEVDGLLFEIVDVGCEGQTIDCEGCGA